MAKLGLLKSEEITYSRHTWTNHWHPGQSFALKRNAEEPSLELIIGILINLFRFNACLFDTEIFVTNLSKLPLPEDFSDRHFFSDIPDAKQECAYRKYVYARIADLLTRLELGDWGLKQSGYFALNEKGEAFPDMKTLRNEI